MGARYRINHAIVNNIQSIPTTPTKGTLYFSIDDASISLDLGSGIRQYGGKQSINSLTSTDPIRPLSALQGKILDDKITQVNNRIDSVIASIGGGGSGTPPTGNYDPYVTWILL